MKDIYTALFQLVICMALGFILRKNRVINERSEKTLTEILLQAVLPFSIIASSQYRYSEELFNGLIAVAIASTLYYCVTLLIMRIIMRKTRVSNDEARVMISTIVFANTGFLGLPIMDSLFGESGLLLAAVYNILFNIFFYTFGIHILSGKRFKVSELFLNPVTASSVLAVILFIIPWRVPTFITDTVNLVGNMMIPLSMMVMGSILTTVDLKKFFVDGKAFIVSLLRLVVIPAVMFLLVFSIGKIIPISRQTASVIILMTAMPCGVINVLVAEKENRAPKFAARTIIMSFVFMMITLPVFVYLCHRFF